jgi:hypothetical protein
VYKDEGIINMLTFLYRKICTQIIFVVCRSYLHYLSNLIGQNNLFLPFLHHFCVFISFRPFPSRLYVHSIVIPGTYLATAGDSLEHLLSLPVILSPLGRNRMRERRTDELYITYSSLNESCFEIKMKLLIITNL